jgi:hypothetical protein
MRVLTDAEQAEKVENPVIKSFRARDVRVRRLSSSDVTEGTDKVRPQRIDNAERETGEKDETIVMEESSVTSQTQLTVGANELKQDESRASSNLLKPAVTFSLMQPAASPGLTRSKTGLEVNTEPPGAPISHENRSRSKKKKRVKSPEDVTKSGKKKRAKSPGLKEGSRGAISSSEAISSSVGHRKKRLRSGKKSKSPHKRRSGSTAMDRSDSRKSS